MSDAMEPFFGKTKPSEFLQAMVDGLRAAAETPGQGIRMSTFGEVGEDGVCYGCAATWALQDLAGKPLTAGQVNWLSMGIDLEYTEMCGVSGKRIRFFEIAMDYARKGELGNLADFCGTTRAKLSPWLLCWRLTTTNWQEELPAVEVAIAEMQEAGL